MKPKLFLLVITIACASLAQAQPIVRAALNAVSYTAPGLPGSGIAQGSIFAVFGSNLGPTTPGESGLDQRPRGCGDELHRLAANYDAPTFSLGQPGERDGPRTCSLTRSG
jgi:hypothetical protein